MSTQVWWFVARSTGLVAYALLGIAVAVGLTLSSGALGRRPVRDWVIDWHRFVSGLALLFTGAHLIGLLLDDFVQFGIGELLVPFMSRWRPLAVAAGVVALYLALAVQVTSLLRQRMSRRWWRRVHSLSLPAFVLATAHLLAAGTDARHPAVLLVVGGAGATTGLLLAVRLRVVARDR